MPAASWKPADFIRLMLVGTVCLCMILIVACTTLGVYYGKISPDALGTVGKGGVGTGMACMLGLLIYGAKGAIK